MGQEFSSWNKPDPHHPWAQCTHSAPHSIPRAQRGSGRPLFEASPHKGRVLSPQASWCHVCQGSALGGGTGKGRAWSQVPLQLLQDTPALSFGGLPAVGGAWKGLPARCQARVPDTHSVSVRTQATRGHPDSHHLEQCCHSAGRRAPHPHHPPRSRGQHSGSASSELPLLAAGDRPARPAPSLLAMPQGFTHKHTRLGDPKHPQHRQGSPPTRHTRPRSGPQSPCHP